MKKTLIAIAMIFSLALYSQKDQLKELKKIVRSEDYKQLKTLVDKYESVFANSDKKYKSKFNEIKLQAYYNLSKAEPTDFDLLDNTIQAFKNADNSAPNIQMKGALLSEVHAATVKFYNDKNYSKAMKGFEELYKLSPKDTVYLYSSATVGLGDVSLYDESLRHYVKLIELGYDGSSVEYVATNKSSNEEETFLDKITRDLNVKSGGYDNPQDKKIPSKKPEIIKNYALILVQQGKADQALEAIDNALKNNPEDIDLILSKADLYYKMNDFDNYKKCINIAIEKDPENVSLYYNLGVASSSTKNYDDAITYYKKALELKPDFTDAALNLSSAYLEKGNLLVNKMNTIAEKRKFDEKAYEKVKSERSHLLEKSAQVLEDVMAKTSDKKQQVLSQLKNIYSALGNTASFKRIKALIESGN